MTRISVTQAVRNFSDLLNRVQYQGSSFELERGNKVIALLTPAELKSPLTMNELGEFLASLPSLADDANAFARDVESARRGFKAETDAWE